MGDTIKDNSRQRYYQIVIVQVNKDKEKSEGQKRKTKTGMRKVSGLSHNREK